MTSGLGGVSVSEWRLRQAVVGYLLMQYLSEIVR